MLSTADVGTFAPVFPTRVLRPFLQQVRRAHKPAIADIGPVVGQNIQFLLAQGLTVYVHDVFTGWDASPEEDMVENGPPRDLGEALAHRLPSPPGGFDGILGWDSLDILDPLAAQRFLGQLHLLLKPGGLLLTLFGPIGCVPPQRAKYVIVDEGHLAYGWTTTRRPSDHSYANQQIHTLCRGFHLAHYYWLRNGMRELLLRKDDALSEGAS